MSNYNWVQKVSTKNDICHLSEWLNVLAIRTNENSSIINTISFSEIKKKIITHRQNFIYVVVLRA
jgi:hypothetical protein